jgi:hypothetical protein
MSLAVITVSAQSPSLDTRAQEVALISRALELAAQAIRAAGGTVTSGNILGDGAVVLGTFVYSPVASS